MSGSLSSSSLTGAAAADAISKVFAVGEHDTSTLASQPPFFGVSVAEIEDKINDGDRFAVFASSVVVVTADDGDVDNEAFVQPLESVVTAVDVVFAFPRRNRFTNVLVAADVSVL